MENKMGCEGVPLARIIHKDKPLEWTPALATNELNHLIYPEALTEDKYDQDKITLLVCL